MLTLTAFSPSASRCVPALVVLAAVAAVGIGSPLAGQELQPDGLECAELGVDDQQSPPVARQLYREADRELDESPAVERSRELARVYLRAAELDSPCSYQRVRAYRRAGRLLAHAGHPDQARTWMEKAAELAVAHDRPGPAIHFYLDAAEAAVQADQERRALADVRRARDLKRENDLESASASLIEDRLESDPVLLGLLERDD